MPHIMLPKHSTLILALVLAAAAACSSKSEVREPEGYRVLSHDTKTGEWVILRNGTFDGKYMVKRITVVCDFYKSGDREIVKGPDACDLQVGALMVPNATDKKKPYLDVYEMSPERLAFIMGWEPNHVSQQFVILKYEVLQ